MRGGEGLAKAIQYLCFQTPEAVYFSFFNDCELVARPAAGAVRIKQVTRYPYQGHVGLEILPETTPQSVKFHLYLSPSSSNPALSLNGVRQNIKIDSDFVEWNGQVKPGDVLIYHFELALRFAPMINQSTLKKHHALRHGPLLLACEAADAQPNRLPPSISNDGRYEMDGVNFSPLNDMVERPGVTPENYKRRILYEIQESQIVNPRFSAPRSSQLGNNGAYASSDIRQM